MDHMAFFAVGPMRWKMHDTPSESLAGRMFCDVCSEEFKADLLYGIPIDSNSLKSTIKLSKLIWSF